VKKSLVGVLVVASMFLGVGVASASASPVKREQAYINSQMKSQVFPVLTWQACSLGSVHGQCASTNGGAVTGNKLSFGAYPKELVMKETGATASSNIEASMNQVIGQTIQYYAGTKAAQWSSGVADAGTPARNETKDFGSWAVQVKTSAVNRGTVKVTLTLLG